MAVKLHELRITGRDRVISNSVFSRISSEDYNHLLNVFASLRKINISVNSHQDSYPLNFAGLGRLLTHARSLQFLDLKSPGLRFLRSRLTLSQMFQDFIWLHLKHIGLSGFIMHTDMGLIALLCRHRETVESVALEAIFLHAKDTNSEDRSPCEAWKNFFGTLRKLSVKFKTLHLSRIHDCCNHWGIQPDIARRVDGGAKVLQYLRDGGPNPLTYRPIHSA